MDLSHYSPSQFNMASDCGRKYYYKYIKKVYVKDRANIFYVLGSAADRAVERGFKEDISVSQIFQEELSKEISSNLMLSEEDLAAINKQSTLLEIALVNYFQNFVDYSPVSFQRKMSIRLNGLQRQVFGYADIIAKRGDKNLIIDIKTSGKQVQEPIKTHRDQVLFYALCLMKMDNLEEIPDLEIHYLVKTKEPKINIVPVEVNESDLYHLISMMRSHEWKIKQGYFPLNRTSMWCTPNGCEFYEHCHSENKLGIKDVMEQLR